MSTDELLEAWRSATRAAELAERLAAAARKRSEVADRNAAAAEEIAILAEEAAASAERAARAARETSTEARRIAHDIREDDLTPADDDAATTKTAESKARDRYRIAENKDLARQHDTDGSA